MKSQITLRKQPLPFTQVPNELLCNPEISALAKTLWCILYSKPDSWTFFWNEILTHFREGRDAVKRACKELEQFGYLRKYQKKALTGRGKESIFSGMEIEIFYEPVLEPQPDCNQQNQPSSPITENQLTGNPLTGNQVTGNQSTDKYIKNKYLSNKYLNNKTPPTPSSSNQKEKIIPESQFVGVFKNGGELIGKITEQALMKSKQNAPGWDIYYLANVYVGGIPQRGMPDNLNLAFPEWCRRYTKGEQP
jgi:hypothetical protein